MISVAIIPHSCCLMNRQTCLQGPLLLRHVSRYRSSFERVMLTPKSSSEVQLLIDGQLAGVSWPFPIIFTGGIVPGFWRPIVGIDAFDLRQHEIDVTPWLPLLCDGASHTFEIRVAGLNDDGAGHATLSEIVGTYWVVTGTIFLFLGQDGSVTTGTSPSIDTPLPEIQISSSVTTNSTGANETLTYSTGTYFRSPSILLWTKT